MTTREQLQAWDDVQRLQRAVQHMEQQANRIKSLEVALRDVLGAYEEDTGAKWPEMWAVVENQ